MDNRTKILTASLRIEHDVSLLLANFLGINEPEKSASFGNTSKALTFNQKIILFTDLGVINSDQKTKFMTFMEIRNQFMHNAKANTFEECLSFIDGKDRWLLKVYQPNKENAFEDQLKEAVERLTEDVIKQIFEIHDKLLEQFGAKYITAEYKTVFGSFEKIFKEKTAEYCAKYSSEMYKGNIYTGSEVSNILVYLFNDIASDLETLYPENETS